MNYNFKDIINIYSDPIIANKRKGTPEDPFIRKTETLTVNNGKVLLTEIPNKQNKVIVTDGVDYLLEIIDGELNEEKYKVDYTMGVVYFSNSWSNKELTFKYLGEGSLLFPAARIWAEKNGNAISLKDKLADLDREDAEQRARVNNLINSTPQPDEVVDMRVDDNGQTFETAKERVDDLQKKLETAYVGHESLKDRLDGIDQRNEDDELLLGYVEDFKANGYSLTDKLINEFKDRAINVKWLGAKGDGTADDGDAIQAALNLGGKVIIPSGTYNTSKSLVIKANTTVEMTDQTVVKATNDIYCVFKNGDSTDSFKGYDGNSNIKILGGTIDCNGQTITKPIGGIVFGHCENIEFKDVKIINVRDIHHIEINSTRNCVIDGCTFKGFYGDRTFSEAIQIDLPVSNSNFPIFGEWDNTVCKFITIRDCDFRDVGAGIGTHVQSAQLWHDHILIENCEFHDLKSHGISALNFKKFKFMSNVMVNVDNGIYMNGSYDGSIYNNDFKDAKRNGIQITNSESIHIEQPTISRSGENGITLYDSCKNIHVSNANIAENSSNGINFANTTECSVKNSKIVDNFAHGIYIHDESSFITISDNFVKNNGYSGVNLSIKALDCEINHNYINGNATNNPSNVYSNINVYSGAKQNVIKNNTIRKGNGNPRFGIAIGSDAGDKNAINSNNVTDGGVSGEFSNAQGTTIIEALEWKPLALMNGWTPYSAGTPVRYAVKGDQIVFRGIIKPGITSGADNDSSMVFKLPPEDTPKLSIFKITGGIGGGSTDFARCNFFLSGRMTIPTIGNLEAVDLTGLTILYYTNSR